MRAIRGENLVHVAIFGHNPDFDAFLRRCGLASDIPDLPTCGCACVEFPSWEHAKFESAKIVSFLTPKMLK